MNLVDLARRLKNCRLQPASFEKGLIRRISALESDAQVTEAQAYYLKKIAHRYRRQLGKCPVDECPACAGKPWPAPPPTKKAARKERRGAEARKAVAAAESLWCDE